MQEMMRYLLLACCYEYLGDYLGDGSYILNQLQLDTNYFIGLAIFALCQGQAPNSYLIDLTTHCP